MPLTIRPFTPEDYPALCEVATAVEPDYPWTVEEARFQDEHREAKCRWERFVAEWDGRVAGLADYGQSSGMYHPRKFWLSASVRPELQGRGIGSALYRRVLEVLAPLDPILVRASAREDRERSVRFLADRGFTETMREWESRLDLRTFDPAPFDGAGERLHREGIEIRTMRELEADPDRDRKLHALRNELEADVPAPDTVTAVEFEPWIEKTLSNPGLLPDAWFIAVDRGEYVGYTQLWRPGAGDFLDTGLTAVRRTYRRRGIALALKLRAIAFAQEQGVPEIRTWNATHNEGMLSINVRLGFKRQPAWIEYVKMLGAE